MGVRLDGGPHQLLIRDAVPSVPDVISNRHPEEDRLLRHDADLISEPVHV